MINRSTLLAFLALFVCSNATATASELPDNSPWPVIVAADGAAHARAGDGYRSGSAGTRGDVYDAAPLPASRRPSADAAERSSLVAETRELASGVLLLGAAGLLALVLTRRRVRYPMHP